MTKFEIAAAVVGVLLAFGSIPLGFSGRIRLAASLVITGFTLMMYVMLLWKLAALAYFLIQSGIFLYWEWERAKASTLLILAGIAVLLVSLTHKI